MKKGTNTWKILIWLILLGAVLAVSALQETIIIDYGVVLFRFLWTVLLAVTVIFTVYLLISLIRSAARRRKDQQEQQRIKEQQKARKAEADKADARLSVRGKLDEHDMYQMLTEKANGKWNRLSPEIDICLRQMDRMNDYQAKLSGLLDINGVESLKDTEEMLDAVEQYTFRNIRKVINYMNVLDPDAPDDREKAREQLARCTEDNGQRLNQVQDFLLAPTDYLNKQGEGSQEIDMLQMYKDTILSSLEEMTQ